MEKEQSNFDPTGLNGIRAEMDTPEQPRRFTISIGELLSATGNSMHRIKTLMGKVQKQAGEEIHRSILPDD